MHETNQAPHGATLESASSNVIAGAEKVPGPRSLLDLAYLPQTDWGNGERFVERLGDRFRFVPAAGWHYFDGSRWTNENSDIVALRAAAGVALSIRDEAQAIGHTNDSDDADKFVASLRRWSKTSQSVTRCRAMLEMARARLTANLSEFDRDLYALNTRSGTLRFRKIEPGHWTIGHDPHEASDLITRMASVEYDPHAQALLWEAHVERVLPDVEVRAFVQRLFGYCLLGLQTEQAFIVFQGRGGDGKSTTVNVLRRILGDYAKSASIETFLEKTGRSGSGATPDLARLSGDVRMVSTAEPPRGAKLSESLIKTITGKGELTARFLNREFFDYVPRWKLIIECNAKPTISGSDDGIWRRAVLVLWPRQLLPEEMDRDLEEKLMREASGILNWLIEGAISYLEGGLMIPDAVKAALEDYRSNASSFREWFFERCVLDEAAEVEVRVLIEDYKDWCARGGIDHPLGERAFQTELSNMQVIRIGKRSHPDRRAMRRGARLKLPGGGAWRSASGDKSFEIAA
ncbi:MAG: phage/plasmid primase, P4 family [Hyphomonadaceae bacterium]